MAEQTTIYDEPNRVLGKIDVTHYEATQFINKWVQREAADIRTWPDGEAKNAAQTLLNHFAGKVNAVIRSSGVANGTQPMNRAERRRQGKG